MDNQILNKLKEQLNTLAKQEEMLHFDSFTNEDALKLGNFIVDEARNQNLAMAVAIRKSNGAILFHHLMTGTSKTNQKWMERKFNTVCHFEHSSLRYFVTEKGFEDSVKNQGLSEQEYVFCGGGFPVVLKTGEFAGVVTVSNLPHYDDHRFLVECISKWLNVKDVPIIKNDIEI